jgi:hypothetical protein
MIENKVKKYFRVLDTQLQSAHDYTNQGAALQHFLLARKAQENSSDIETQPAKTAAGQPKTGFTGIFNSFVGNQATFFATSDILRTRQSSSRSGRLAGASP